MLNRRGKSGHPAFFLILEKIFQFFTNEYDVGCGLFIYGLDYVEIIFFYS